MSEARTSYQDIPDPPRSAFEAILKQYEGGYQALDSDWGNWSSGRQGMGFKIGTNRGVSAPTFIAWRGIDIDSVPRVEIIGAIRGLKHEEAVEIAWNWYFVKPGFYNLPWSRLTEFFFDWGWGSGQGTAVLALQELVGVAQDGIIGSETAAAYWNWVSRVGLPEAVEQAIDARLATADRDNRPGQERFKAAWRERYEAFSFYARPDGAPPPPFRGDGHRVYRPRPAARTMARDVARLDVVKITPVKTAPPRLSFFGRIWKWIKDLFASIIRLS